MRMNSDFLSLRQQGPPLSSVPGLSEVAKIFRSSSHVLYFETMSDEIQMHDIVALLEDTPARHFLRGQQLLLRRGQIGTVVMTYDGTTFEVEFAGRDGRAYAILPVKTEKLMVLRDSLEPAAV